MNEIPILVAIIGGIASAAAALIAFIGNLLSNRGQHQRLREQIRFDVYLRAAEAVVKLQWLLMSVANIDIPDGKLTEGYQNEMGAIGKIQLVGSTETIRTVSVLMTTYAAAFLDVSLKRSALQLLKKELDHSNEMAEVIQKSMTEHAPGANLWGLHRDAVQKKFFDDRLGLLQKCSAHAAGLMEPVCDAVIAVRNEVNFPLEVEQYIRISKQAAETSRKNIELHLQGIRDVVAEAIMRSEEGMG